MPNWIMLSIIIQAPNPVDLAAAVEHIVDTGKFSLSSAVRCFNLSNKTMLSVIQAPKPVGIAAALQPFSPPEDVPHVISELHAFWLRACHKFESAILKEHLQSAKFGKEFAVLHRDVLSAPFKRVIIKRQRPSDKKSWEVINELGNTRLGMLPHDGENGVLAMWSEYFASPTKEHYDEAVREAEVS